MILLERVLSHTINLPSGCLQFEGKDLNSTGYPRLQVWSGGVRSRMSVHRVVFEAHHGPVPQGLKIDHLCHNEDLTCPGGVQCLHRRCVRLDHMEAVTNRENVLRGQGPTAQHARVTECPKGHPYSGNNLIIRSCGRRRCRACHTKVAS